MLSASSPVRFLRVVVTISDRLGNAMGFLLLLFPYRLRSAASPTAWFTRHTCSGRGSDVGCVLQCYVSAVLNALCGIPVTATGLFVYSLSSLRASSILSRTLLPFLRAGCPAEGEPGAPCVSEPPAALRALSACSCCAFFSAAALA